ncbi:GH25 family lysozyme [Hamadaea tsunoensis]|uniref:GH25 family lysozyme n=1 Tax=Hamadaea tsunoensis TaxID=53368 RepID=UPI00042153A1|nr:GH25 family lysozyme [Hamadaea tsunoensis]
MGRRIALLLIVVGVLVAPASSAVSSELSGEVTAAVPAAAVPLAAAAPLAASVGGVEAGAFAGTVTWTTVHNAGVQYAYIKATEGASTKDTSFGSNYPNAYYAGLIRGALHVARPNQSSGTAQADFLAGNGGAWSADGQTLPAAVDLEPNPISGGYCYGLGTSAMVSWITAFVNEYHARTTRWPVIQTTTSFWKLCTGNSTAFGGRSPLAIIHWDTAAGTLPAGWSVYTFWLSTDCQPTAGMTGCPEASVFNGAQSRLVALANNT